MEFLKTQTIKKAAARMTKRASERHISSDSIFAKLRTSYVADYRDFQKVRKRKDDEA